MTGPTLPADPAWPPQCQSCQRNFGVVFTIFRKAASRATWPPRVNTRFATSVKFSNNDSCMSRQTQPAPFTVQLMFWNPWKRNLLEKVEKVYRVDQLLTTAEYENLKEDIRDTGRNYYYYTVLPVIQ